MSNPGPYKFKHTIVIASDKTTKRGGYYDTDFDVGCIVSNDLGRQGYEYGKDFYFEDAGCDEVCFSAKDPKVITYLGTKYDQPSEPVHG